MQNKQQFFYFSLYGSSYELSIILIKLFTRGKNNLPIFLYILRVILGTNKREREGEEEETKWSNLCYFILYISIYNSHFALIFLTKNCTVFTIGIVFYISFIRTFIAHFPTVNRSFVPFLSYSSTSPFFHYGANFLFFRIENDRYEKNDRKSLYNTIACARCWWRYRGALLSKSISR